ncbi:unnamed protein product [Ambrosiozyma monospora]|uniref:Unnamed protein product n=1 Tax=Ambrosiozyma monospora TaxID=43982 RepID=A0ACB5TQC7_AMBMO|nr:unnamed protein product [Ambrosiozyma monospora]
MSFKVIAAKQASLLDQELMSTMGFSIDQLMELAGLSVAQSIYRVYPPTTTPSNKSSCLVLCGPGNNGGDGLVAARHLKLFGYNNIQIYYPKPTNRPIFTGLVTQLQQFGIEFIDSTQLSKSFSQSNLIIDALFGFSFKPPMRPPFNSIISEMLKWQLEQDKKIIAVDIPSGWDVDLGPTDACPEIANYQPDLLVSLTAPKPCSLKLNKSKKHYLGGRFISKQFAEKWGIDVPEYPGVDQVVQLQ